jgi:hypothetical protein
MKSANSLGLISLQNLLLSIVDYIDSISHALDKSARGQNRRLLSNTPLKQSSVLLKSYLCSHTVKKIQLRMQPLSMQPQ